MIDFKQILPARYRKCNPKRKRLVRLGCAALALALAVGSVPFLRGWAAEETAVSGSDIVSQSDAAPIGSRGTVTVSRSDAPSFRASSVFNWVKANAVTDFDNAAHGSNSRISYYSGVTNWLHSSGQAFAEAQGLDYRKCYFLTSWDGSRFIAAYKDQPSSVVTTGYKNASAFESYVNNGVTFFYVPFTETEDISLADALYEVNVDETITILPSFTPAWSNDPVTWESADPAVASVVYRPSEIKKADGSCQVTGMGAGITTLTATVNGHTVTCQVAVSGAPYSDLSIINNWTRATTREAFANARTFSEDYLADWYDEWYDANKNKRFNLGGKKFWGDQIYFVQSYIPNSSNPDYDEISYFSSGNSYPRTYTVSSFNLTNTCFMYMPKSDLSFTYHVAVQPTCTEAGSIAYWTDQDGNKFADASSETPLADEDIPIAAPGHDWGEVIDTEATCEETGVMHEECSICHEERNEGTVIDALGHDWDYWVTTTPATCSAPGEKTRTCKNDPSHTETEVIPALTHNWYAWTAVEGYPGLQEHDCANCGEHETRIHPFLQFVVTAGNGQTYTKGSQEPITVKFDKEDVPDPRNVNVYQMFENGGTIDVTAPDGTVTTLSSGDFTAAEGSLDVTLSADYLEGLEDGDYTMTVTFVVAPDYEKTSAPASFTVSSPAPAGSDSPATGESIALISVSLALMLLAAYGAVYALRRRRALGE